MPSRLFLPSVMRLSAKINEGVVYGLLELTPELEEALRSGCLYLRSDKSRESVAACTETQTFSVRRLNQTNTLLLSTQDGDDITAFGTSSNLLEPILSSGSVDLPSIAVYRRQNTFGPSETMEELQNRSMCSAAEFRSICEENAVFEYCGKVCKLEDETIYFIVNELISTIIGEGLGLTARFEEVVEVSGTQECKEAVEAVYKLFYDDEMGQIDTNKAAVWIGRYLLGNLAGEVTAYDFMKQWQHKTPVHLQLDITKLEGHFFEPRKGVIRSLSVDKLSKDPRVRFQQLFQLKNEWDLDEMGPFIRDLMNINSKLENWVLKYARRVKKDGHVFILPRKL